jgi:hypothetical protein
MGGWEEGGGAVSLGTAPWDRIFFDFLPVHALSTAILYRPHHCRKDIYDRKITVPKYGKGAEIRWLFTWPRGGLIGASRLKCYTRKSDFFSRPPTAANI